MVGVRGLNVTIAERLQQIDFQVGPDADDDKGSRHDACRFFGNGGLLSKLPLCAVNKLGWEPDCTQLEFQDGRPGRPLVW